MKTETKVKNNVKFKKHDLVLVTAGIYKGTKSYVHSVTETHVILAREFNPGILIENCVHTSGGATGFW